MNSHVNFKEAAYLYDGLVQGGRIKYWVLSRSKITEELKGQILETFVTSPHGTSLGSPDICDAICLRVISSLHAWRYEGRNTVVASLRTHTPHTNTHIQTMNSLGVWV